MTARHLALLLVLGACTHREPQAPPLPADETPAAPPPPTSLPAPAILARPDEPPDGCEEGAGLDVREQQSADFNAWSLHRALQARELEEVRRVPVALPAAQARGVGRPGDVAKVGERVFVVVGVEAEAPPAPAGHRSHPLPYLPATRVLAAQNTRTHEVVVVDARPRYRCRALQVRVCEPGQGIRGPDPGPVRQRVRAIEVDATPASRVAVEYPASEVGPPRRVREFSCPQPP